MNKRFASLALIAATIFCASAKNDDPVLMKVNGKDVKMSEFEYLYNKNNSQQVQKQSIDEYVDMFVTYKLKVADAEAAGIDTTTAFINEFKGHRNELATPYLEDKTILERLMNEAYARMHEEVNVSHLMLHISEDPIKNKESKELLDSIKREIKAGNATFAEMVEKYSTDRSTKSRGGNMGWLVANRWPYSFEKAAWDTQVGEISDVVETFAGFHLIMVNGRRPSQGQVNAKHILKLTHGKTPADAEIAKAQIDSIYNILASKSPSELSAAFSEIAKTESECGSRQNGGELGWFGAGQMVPEFEVATFALNNGEMSKPVQTQFGWHIIYRIDSKGVGSFEECKPTIQMVINNDERGLLPQKEFAEKMKIKHNATIIQKNVDKIFKVLDKHGAYDSTFIAKYIDSDFAVIKVGDETIPAKKVFKMLPKSLNTDVAYGKGQINSYLNAELNSCGVDYENRHLEEYYPEFRNLVNEYRDGILLFEVSNRNVWEKAAKDKEGLEKYFQANRAKYDNWTAPKYKGFIVFATNDSIMNEAKTFLEGQEISVDSVANVLRQKFTRKDIRVERVIAAKGENAIVDYVAFGCEKPSNEKNKWKSYFGYMGKIITSPEEAADVRGQVTSDYQSVLEKEWINSLKAKYPVKIKTKELNKLKQK
ncbi:MAG: peptidylprolyl isomerase [Muribaculaceae bacterium]|nr:peptidylprolyl isomerase [Muribaculaceae bacterium]